MRVEVNGVHLFFDIEGVKYVCEGGEMREKPALLLLHGFGGDHSMFKPSFSEFADVAQLVYLDMRGHGRSESGPPKTWSLAQWGDDVAAFCDALGIERPIVLGESFGGFVAQSYASRHPQHPGKLVLLCTCPSPKRYREHSLAMFEKRGGSEARAAAAAIFDRPSPESDAAYARFCLPLYARGSRFGLRTQTFPPERFAAVVQNQDASRAWAAGESRDFDLAPGLCAIECPTLVISGEDDPVCPVEGAEEIARMIRAGLARLERLAGFSHNVYDDDNPVTMRLIRQFILG
jgi:proline iminopeptidase